MYGRYPFLIRELSHSLSRAVATEPTHCCELLETILEELEADQKLMEDLFAEVLKRNRENNEILQRQLRSGSEDGESEIIRRAYHHWELAGSGLRDLLNQAFSLSHTGFFSSADQDQESSNKN